MRIAKGIISAIAAAFLLLGLVSLMFHTDFGLHRWAPMWLQEIVIGLMVIWWIGIAISVMRFKMD